MSCQKVLRYITLTISILFAIPSFAQHNIGFENGTFDNWDFAVGNIQKDGKITTFPSIAVPGSFTILKNDQSGPKDNYGKFSIFSPNGSKYCVKLGNELYGNTVQQMSYTLTIPPIGSSNIIFNYAVVLENPGHEPYQQPRFTVKIYNVTDDKYLDCPAFDFISSSSLPGFKYNSDGVFYKDWSSASINLSGLNNKKVRLEFTVNHCPFGEHAGYAYIDVDENISTPVQGNNYCINQAAVNLSGPPGFATYSWSTADLKTTLGTGQHLTIPPPPDKTKLALTVSPFDGLGCSDTYYFDMNSINSDLDFSVIDEIVGCPGSAVDLTRPDVILSSSPNLTFEYLNESFELLPAPKNITQAGIYYVSAKNPAGCTNLLPVKISFGIPDLTLSILPAVEFPATVDLTKSFTRKPDVSYSYYNDKNATSPLPNFEAVEKSGIYYIKAETSFGCVNIQPINVTITAPKQTLTLIPNTFTPNNDGVNDYLTVPFNRSITLSSFSVYNRNGTLIFNTTDPTHLWDGTYNGRPVSAGVYYWVFKGYDKYYLKNIEKSSFITLIR